jgi:hypothetical protein
MRWILNISALFIILFICSAHGCNDTGELSEIRAEKMIESSKDSIRNIFETDMPDDEQLKGFEETAKQKLIDFSDYMKIVSDSSLEITFRKQAARMASALFKSPELRTVAWNADHPGTEPQTIDELLEKNLSDGMKYWLIPEQLSIKNPFSNKSDSLYTGSLKFCVEPKYFAEQNKTVLLKDWFYADVYAVKTNKFFGNQRLTIWEVRLGDIKGRNPE